MAEWLECPKCGSDDLQSGQADRDVDIVWYETECVQCGFEWHEVFKFAFNEDPDCRILGDDGKPLDLHKE